MVDPRFDPLARTTKEKLIVLFDIRLPEPYEVEYTKATL